MKILTPETLAYRLSLLTYTILDCATMMNVENCEKCSGMIISPYAKDSPQGEGRLTKISKVFLDKMLYRTNYQDTYIAFRDSDEIHSTMLQKAYLAMLCAAWCSYRVDADDELIFQKVRFFVHETQTYINQYLMRCLMMIFQDPSIPNKLQRSFDYILEVIIFPLFTKGTFVEIDHKEYGFDRYDTTSLMLYDFWSEQLLLLQHSIEIGLSQEPAIIEEKFRERVQYFRHVGHPSVRDYMQENSQELEFENACLVTG
jgi:hypothetical protein